MKVAIVGAGVAGLAAARALRRSGVEVTVFEAQKRIGGRIKTCALWGQRLDMGASWIHGVDGNPIRSLAQEAGLKTLPTDHAKKGVRLRDETWMEEHDVATLLARCDGWLKECSSASKGAQSLAEGIEAHAGVLAKEEREGDLANPGADFSPDLMQEARAWRLCWLASVVGADPEELSGTHWNQDEELGGGDRIFTLGYGAVVAYLARGARILRSHGVSRIAQSAKGVRVTAAGSTYDFDHCVVTVPLALLKRGEIDFDPPLSEAKRTSLGALGVGCLNKVWIRFERQVLPSDFTHLVALGREHGFAGLFNHGAFTGSAVGVLLAGGSQGIALESLGAREIEARARAYLRDLLGLREVSVGDIVVTRWCADRWARGSYSHVALGASGEDYARLAEPEGGVGFAGEATHRQYPATVHGAYLSGLREAGRILGERL